MYYDDVDYCDNCHHQARNHSIYEDDKDSCNHCDPKTGKYDCNCSCFDNYENWKPKNKKEADNWYEDKWFKKHAKVERILTKSVDDKPLIEKWYIMEYPRSIQKRLEFIHNDDPNFEKEFKKIK